MRWRLLRTARRTSQLGIVQRRHQRRFPRKERTHRACSVSPFTLVPLPTYILGPVTASQSKLYGKSVEDGGDLCSNLTYLGRRGFFTLSSGLQIAYLSGIYDETIYSKSERDPEHFLKEDTDYLLSRTTGTDYMGVDILLTTEWPKSVSNFAASPEGLDTNNVGSAPISQLAQALKPRYHFASLMKTFYERSPYRNHKILQESQTHVTRFIALANTNNPDKKKRYLYAFNVAPMATMMREALIVQPPNVTECPYQSLGVQQKQSLKTEQQKSYFFDMGSGQESRKRGDSQQYEQGPHPKQHKPPSQCSITAQSTTSSCLSLHTLSSKQLIKSCIKAAIFLTICWLTGLRFVKTA
eukprot:m.85212 g.85212  ORF g.85212 m.85212 type:complete len:354 (+) comp36434_c0_seq6:140-1201(+)